MEKLGIYTGILGTQLCEARKYSCTFNSSVRRSNREGVRKLSQLSSLLDFFYARFPLTFSRSCSSRSSEPGPLLISFES